MENRGINGLTKGASWQLVDFNVCRAFGGDFHASWQRIADRRGATCRPVLALLSTALQRSNLRVWQHMQRGAQLFVLTLVTLCRCALREKVSVRGLAADWRFGRIVQWHWRRQQWQQRVAARHAAHTARAVDSIDTAAFGSAARG